MTAAWAVARRRKRLDTVDTAYGIGFIVIALIVLAQQPSWRSAIVAVLVSLWGGRLAKHIYRRSRNHDEDPRYKELSDKWRGNFWLRAYGSIFMVQAIVIWLVSLPVMFAAGETTGSALWWTLLGAAIWIGGFTIERTADRQLSQFLSKGSGAVTDTGLWRYSRHPNYFGELMQWYGIATIALAAQNGYFGFIGPVILTLVIVFISGLPPIERKHRNDPKWHDYIRKTSVLIPWPPKS